MLFFAHELMHGWLRLKGIKLTLARDTHLTFILPFIFLWIPKGSKEVVTWNLQAKPETREIVRRQLAFSADTELTRDFKFSTGC